MFIQPSTRRRWCRPRYGLRTLLLLLTGLSLWLGWQTKIVRDRKEAVRDFEQQGILVYYKRERFKIDPSVPAWRRWLGDRPVDEFRFNRDHAHWVKYNQHHPESERMELLFPEASRVAIASWRPLVPRQPLTSLQEQLEVLRYKFDAGLISERTYNTQFHLARMRDAQQTMARKAETAKLAAESQPDVRD